MRVQIPTYFNQMSPDWATKILGFNTDARYNFYNYACLISCLAMVARYYGKNETPLTMNDHIKQIEGFQKGTALYKHGAFHLYYGDIQEKRVSTPSLLSDDQMREIKENIAKGYPVMVQIDYNPVTVHPDQHFVLFVDFNENDENDFTIIDPIGGKIRSLKDYLKNPIDRARETIQQYIIFSGTIPVNAIKKQTIVVNLDDWEKGLRAMGNVERIGDELDYPAEIIDTPGFGDVAVDKIKQIKTSYNIMFNIVHGKKPDEATTFIDLNKPTSGSQVPEVSENTPVADSPKEQAIAFYDKDLFEMMLSGINKFKETIKWKK